MDSSGFEVRYLEDQRTFDAGVLEMGYNITQAMIIPPDSSSFSVYGVCDTMCTSDVSEKSLVLGHQMAVVLLLLFYFYRKCPDCLERCLSIYVSIYLCCIIYIFFSFSNHQSLGCMHKKYNSPKGSVTKDDNIYILYIYIYIYININIYYTMKPL